MREVLPQTDRLDDAGVDLVQKVGEGRGAEGGGNCIPVCDLVRCIPAQMLTYMPDARIAAKDALHHAYFHGLDRETVGKIPLLY